MTMMKMKSVFPLISVLFLGPALAQDQQQREMDQARVLWDSITQPFPKTYYFHEYKVVGSPDTGFRDSDKFVRVEDNMVTEVYTIGDATNGDNDVAASPNLDSLFDTIQSAIDDWSTSGSDLSNVQVMYDMKLGYPYNVMIEYVNGTEHQTIIGGLTYFVLEQQNLDAARALWNDTGFDNNMYQYTVQYSCFYCSEELLEPKNVQVQENNIVAVTFAATDIEYSPSSAYMTISELFDQIQSSIENQFAYIYVAYDSIYGYPIMVNANPDYGLMDALVSVYVSNLTEAFSPVFPSHSTIMGQKEENEDGMELLEGTVIGGYSARSPQDELDLNKALWENSYMQDYYYAFQRSCFCPLDYTQTMVATVHDTQVQSAYYIETGLPVSSDVLTDGIWSVEQLFDKIQEAIDQNAFAIQVTYDPAYGYPSDIWIDYDETIFHDEFSTFIYYLTPTWQEALQFTVQDGNVVDETEQAANTDNTNNNPPADQIESPATRVPGFTRRTLATKNDSSGTNDFTSASFALCGVTACILVVLFLGN